MLAVVSGSACQRRATACLSVGGARTGLKCRGIHMGWSTSGATRDCIGSDWIGCGHGYVAQDSPPSDFKGKMHHRGAGHSQRWD